MGFSSYTGRRKEYFCPQFLFKRASKRIFLPLILRTSERIFLPLILIKGVGKNISSLFLYRELLFRIICSYKEPGIKAFLIFTLVSRGWTFITFTTISRICQRFPNVKTTSQSRYNLWHRDLSRISDTIGYRTSWIVIREQHWNLKQTT